MIIDVCVCDWDFKDVLDKNLFVFIKKNLLHNNLQSWIIYNKLFCMCLSLIVFFFPLDAISLFFISFCSYCLIRIVAQSKPGTSSQTLGTYNVKGALQGAL